MRRAAGEVVLALLVLGTLAGAAAPAGGVGPAAQGATDPAVQVEADRVEFRVAVHENGSARWRFRYVRTLDNETEREQFRAYAEEFETDRTEAYREFVRQARGLAAAGTNATGRKMTAEAFRRSAGVGGDCVPTDACGTVEMSFRWTAFAREDDDGLVVDDVFEGGLYLGDDQRIVFEAGDGLRFDAAAPDTYRVSGEELADSDSVTWQGPAQFTDRRPRVVFVPAGTAPAGGGTDGSPAGGGAPGSDPANGGVDGVETLLVGGVAVVLVGVALAFANREDLLATVQSDEEAAPVPESAASAPEPAVSEEELLTDEDRVLDLLEDNGGRMKQVDIVDETGWSKSKVSMLLSEMEDDGEISKLRVGRENIVSLAGHEPDAAGSPHED